MGRQFNIAWEGLDPDNPDPKREPSYYEWKIKQMPVSWVPTGRDAQHSVDVDAADVPWILISRDTTNLRLSLQTGFPYILAVRAVDEAGGVETKFIKGRNTLILDSSAFATGTPILTVRERTQGTFQFPGPIIEFEMAAGACVRFEMTGDAEDYGGLVQGYNWGVDVDPDVDGPGSGFAGWRLNRFTEPIADQICDSLSIKSPWLNIFESIAQFLNKFFPNYFTDSIFIYTTYVGRSRWVSV